jgi:chemotaxis signal transduction protein
MRAVVCFDSAGSSYAIPVEQTRQIVLASNLVALPDPLPGVVGILPTDPTPLPVLALFGDAGGYIIVAHDGEQAFGLLVDDVLGLERAEDAMISTAPAGQRDELITGLIETPAGSRLLVDAVTLARRLQA